MSRLHVRLGSYAVGALLVAWLLLVVSPAAQAQGAPGMNAGALNGIINAFNRVRAFEGVLMNEAKILFAGLAVIEFVLVVGRQVIGRADTVDILATVLFQVITLGFFYWLCVNGPDISRAITASFAQVASDASQAAGGTRNISPGDIFNSGLTLVKTVWEAMSIGSPVKSFLLAVAGLVILWVFATVAGMMIEVIVESYFTASAGIVLLGFGASSATRNLAVAQLHLAIAVGMKRLVLQLLVGLSEALIHDWAADVGTNPDWTAIAVMVGVPLVLLRLVNTLPQRAQDMILGTHSNMGLGLGNAPRIGAALAGGAAASAAGGAVATKAAFAEASAQLSAREAAGSGGAISNAGGGRGVMGSISRGAQITGMAAGNLGKAAAEDIGQRMRGTYAAQHGVRPFRMADAMNARADAHRATASNSNSSPAAPGSTRNAGNQVGPAQQRAEP